MSQTGSIHPKRKVPDIPHTVTEDISPSESANLQTRVDDPKESKHRRKMDQYRHSFAVKLSFFAIAVAVALAVVATYGPTPNENNLIPYTIETLKVLSTTAVGFVLGRKS